MKAKTPSSLGYGNAVIGPRVVIKFLGFSICDQKTLYEPVAGPGRRKTVESVACAMMCCFPIKEASDHEWGWSLCTTFLQRVGS